MKKREAKLEKTKKDERNKKDTSKAESLKFFTRTTPKSLRKLQASGDQLISIKIKKKKTKSAKSVLRRSQFSN